MTDTEDESEFKPQSTYLKAIFEADKAGVTKAAIYADSDEDQDANTVKSPSLASSLSRAPLTERNVVAATPAMKEKVTTGNKSTSRWRRVGRIGLGPPKRLAADEEEEEQEQPQATEGDTPPTRPRKAFSPASASSDQENKSTPISTPPYHPGATVNSPVAEPLVRRANRTSPAVLRASQRISRSSLASTENGSEWQQYAPTPESQRSESQRSNSQRSESQSSRHNSQHSSRHNSPQDSQEAQASNTPPTIPTSVPKVRSSLSSSSPDLPSAVTAASTAPAIIPTSFPAVNVQKPKLLSQQEVMSQLRAIPTITINNRTFQRLECIGKGGSSKVYKVMAPNHRIFALKKVSLAKADHRAQMGYINEINLLNRLKGHKQIIRLLDSEIDHEAGSLSILMECGEIDLDMLLKKQHGSPVNFNFIRTYWEQMLSAVQAIHDQKIVHTDLKPANFVLIEGSLKLIDFGIAKAIGNDTTNIHRDTQIGTVNYMSPEAIMTTSARDSGRQVITQGRASDVWSLGCILYQMVYGAPPFAKFTVIQKIQLIPNPDAHIQYPALATPMPTKTVSEEMCKGLAVPVDGDIISAIKNCLERDSKSRLTIPELLQHRFLRPSQPSPARDSVGDDKEMASLSLEQLTDVIYQVSTNTWGRATPPTRADADSFGRRLFVGLKKT